MQSTTKRATPSAPSYEATALLCRGCIAKFKPWRVYDIMCFCTAGPALLLLRTCRRQLPFSYVSRRPPLFHYLRLGGDKWRTQQGARCVVQDLLPSNGFTRLGLRRYKSHPSFLTRHVQLTDATESIPTRKSSCFSLN